MTDKKLKQIPILIVGDDDEHRSFIERSLDTFETAWFSDPGAALRYAPRRPVVLLVIQQRISSVSAVELARRLRDEQAEVLVLVISPGVETGSDDLALREAVESNLVYQYMPEPLTPELLRQNVRRAIEFVALKRHSDRLDHELRRYNDHARLASAQHPAFSSLTADVDRSQHPLEAFVGVSESVRRVRELARAYALSDSPILITGETGTGKELLARGIHAASARSARRFVAINCSAFSEHLVESELFGHEKGAFTGAGQAKRGLLRAADRGTLFLDEVGELAESVQPKVLRVLQFGTFYPIGSERERRVDLRVISATHRDLSAAADYVSSNASVRRDLLYRLNVLHLHLPPLRERPEDIAVLFAWVAAQRGVILPDLSPAAEELLISHPFNGNVRELENLVERIRVHPKLPKDSVTPLSAAALRGLLSQPVGSSDTRLNDHPQQPERVRRELDESVRSLDSFLPELRDGVTIAEYIARVESTLIENTLAEVGGNLAQTARRLGLSRQGLKNKMQRYGVSG